MIRKYFVPALMAAALLTGCRAPQGKFTPEQVAAMKSTASLKAMAIGPWAYPIASCLTRMTTDYVPTAASRSSRWPRGWRLPGSPIAALKAIPIIMVKIATMKPCRLSGPTAWPMPRAEGAHVPRSNLVTRGLGKNTRSPATTRRPGAPKTAG